MTDNRSNRPGEFRIAPCFNWSESFHVNGIVAILGSVLLLLATWLAPGSAGGTACLETAGCPCCASACACMPADTDAGTDSPVAPVTGRGLASDFLVAVAPARLMAAPAASPSIAPHATTSIFFPEAEPLFQRICVRLL